MVVVNTTTIDYHAQRQRLVTLLRERSLERGDFVLASGRRSNVYIDVRRTSMSGEGLDVIGALGLAVLRREGWHPQLVGGLTLGADPIAYAISVAAHRAGVELNAFTVRKEAKAHGTGKRIEGCFSSGATVVVVEDVLTTGRSALDAIRAVETEGGRVIGVLGVVDREEGGADALRNAGYGTALLVNIRDLMGA